jgi:hypothetical protein
MNYRPGRVSTHSAANAIETRVPTGLLRSRLRTVALALARFLGRVLGPA